jgi:hypothetical protein
MNEGSALVNRYPKRSHRTAVAPGAYALKLPFKAMGETFKKSGQGTIGGAISGPIPDPGAALCDDCGRTVEMGGGPTIVDHVDDAGVAGPGCRMDASAAVLLSDTDL